MVSAFQTKKSLIFFIILILASLLTSSITATAQTAIIPTGSGTSGLPYQISELGHLVWMSENAASSSGRYYKIIDDIDASATATWNDAGTDTTLLEGFSPIGGYSNPDTTSFRGIFDGDGHKITGLVINRPSTDYVGLFGRIGVGGEVRNLSLIGGTVSGKYYVGSLVGYNYGTVSNCYITGALSGNYGVGGLVGYNYGTVSNGYTAGQVSGINKIGGLVGVSHSNSSVSYVYATGAVSGTGSYIGGLVGDNYGTVSNAYATGTVSGCDDYVGGLVGRNTYSSISNTYATGAVSANDDYVGGLIGYNDSGTVSNIYANGSVSGDNDVGGLIGYNHGTVSNGYSTGAVSGNTNVGGLIGYNYQVFVWNSYWDIQTSGQNTSIKGTGKTTAEMKQQVTFAAWDFNTTWGIAEGVSYPYLQFSPPPFQLQVSVIGPGHISFSPEPVNGGYAPGTLVTLTATPDTSIDIFHNWQGAIPTGDLTATVLMDGHKKVTAEFLVGIEINSVTDLTKIGNDRAYPLKGAYYFLTVDIDASETAFWNDDGTDTSLLEGFKPIGTYSSSSSDTTSFRAIFDGNGHTITGLTIDRRDINYVGLFGCVGSDGEVRNLGLIGDSLSRGNYYVGGLTGYIDYGKVSNVYATGTVRGYESIGGLVGKNDYGTVSDSYATGTISGSYRIGGLVGYNHFATVLNAYSTGPVSGTGYVGGLIGDNYGGTVSNSYWDIQTSGKSISDGGTGKTTTEMKQQATFVDWNFTNIWIMDENVTYPLLKSFQIPGDANLDGTIDVGDLGILAGNYGLSDTTWFQGDFNGDGVVDVGDLGILAANYGSGVSGTVDFDADCADIFSEEANEEVAEGDTDVSSCSSFGLPLIAFVLLMGFMIVGLKD